jgi:ATP-dependent RNA helicase DDX18/HAS1
LEKLLQKNYFLHQSARDGFRSYLQSYASYSLKKIFDVNKLDLAKVGKAFGFAVPPRVNLNMGVGASTGAKGKKRQREDKDDEIVEEMEIGGGAEGSDVDEEEEVQVRKQQNKQRRVETLGKKRVEREIFKKGKERKKMAASGVQWSR